MKVIAQLLCLTLLTAVLSASTLEELLRDAKAAEAKQQSAQALELYLQADQTKPNDAVILQKIARQYSDLVLDQSNDAERRRYAQIALDFSQRAVAVNPRDPVNVLSLAVCHGKLALYSDNKTKIHYSRLVKEEAERALALDPNYAWAHHVLGRWQYEVASIGGTTRWLAGILYGNLPTASFEEAISHLQRATELEPTELNHVLELGFAYAAAGKKEAARANWERGLAIASHGNHDEIAKRRAREAMNRLNRP